MKMDVEMWLACSQWRNSMRKKTKQSPLMSSHGGLPTWVNKTESPVAFRECFTLKLGCFPLCFLICLSFHQPPVIFLSPFTPYSSLFPLSYSRHLLLFCLACILGSAMKFSSSSVTVPCSAAECFRACRWCILWLYLHKISVEVVTFMLFL